MNEEPTPISTPLPVSRLDLTNGIFKLKDMIRNAETRDDLVMVLPYYHIVMIQITRIEDRELSIKKYEKIHDMYWKKYDKTKG